MGDGDLACLVRLQTRGPCSSDCERKGTAAIDILTLVASGTYESAYSLTVSPPLVSYSVI